MRGTSNKGYEIGGHSTKMPIKIYNYKDLMLFKKSLVALSTKTSINMLEKSSGKKVFNGYV